MPRPISQVPHFAYRVHWDREHAAWRGFVAEFPHLQSEPHPTEVDALAEIIRLAHDHVAVMRMEGITVPPGIMDANYSGSPRIRIIPDIHREIALEAAEVGMSLTSYISQIVASRHTR